jgi:SAM-dependent methyltransferase
LLRFSRRRLTWGASRARRSFQPQRLRHGSSTATPVAGDRRGDVLTDGSDAMTAAVKQWVIPAAKRFPPELRGKIVRNLPGRRVRWGSLRRTLPFSDNYGLDRGLPIDRYYIEAFLAREAASIRGEVLEVLNSRYSVPFGGADVTHFHVVDIDPTNPEATVIADLTVEGSLPDQAYDSIIMTQTLHVTTDDAAGFRTLWRALRPGGTLLFTGPCVSRIDTTVEDWDHWRYTPRGLRALLAKSLPDAEVTVEAHGNVLAGAAFLYGIAVEELSEAELDFEDPRFPLVVCARISKRQSAI